MANLRLRRLKIEKFRNVVPGTELVFGDGMNVLLGRNGTGKTTLLQLIAMVTSSSFGALVEEEFDIEYDVSLLGLGFRVVFVNRPLQASNGRTLRRRGGLDGARTEWSFRVSVVLEDGRQGLVMASAPTGVAVPPQWGLTEPTPVRDPLRDESPLDQAIDVLGGAAALRVERVLADGLANEVAPMQAILDFYREALLFQQQVAQHGGRFDEGLGTFGGIVSDFGFSSVEDAKRAMLFYRRAHWRNDEGLTTARFAPQEVTSAAMHSIRASGVTDLTLQDADLPFLRRALDLIGGKEAKMILKLQKESSPEDGGDATFGDFEFLITMEDGSVFRHDYLSYGQKRLLSFLYYAAANPDIIIADELVNGLHHEWIDACLDEVKDRQCFLTSQNPLLLDYLSFDSAEEVQRTFLLCDRRREGKRTQLVWQHMDRESADSFFRSYRAGVQHVSEILRTKGLW
jgi:energy-coupling factor transporter ATP-binding protein EcfA2